MAITSYDEYLPQARCISTFNSKYCFSDIAIGDCLFDKIENGYLGTKDSYNRVYTLFYFCPIKYGMCWPFNLLS